MLPTITNYGNYDSNNYGAHTLKIETDGIELWYSYKTIVAYFDLQDGLVCSQNIWGTTTGKHLNWIEPDKKKRIKSDEFSKMLEDAIKRHIVQ